MEIAPTTTVKLFSGIALDNTYSDTFYFETLSAQTTYFNSLTPTKLFNSQMYQRVNKGQFEATCRADDIYNCNYMMFQNAGFGNKWFYAFITSVEYINNHNSLVSFEIDVMQTWMFDCHLERCFIERQHSVTDNIGDNILPEPVSLGEYVFDNTRVGSLGYDRIFPSLENNAIVIMTSEPRTEEQWTWGNIYDNVYSGCYVYAVDANSIHASVDIRVLINQFIEKPEIILNIYMCPLYLLPIRDGFNTVEDSYNRLSPVPDESASSTLTYTGEAPNTGDKFGSYTPKNMKLYTYPYNYYHIDNGDGNSLKLRYEFFNNNRPQFEVEGCITTPIQVRLTPYNYKGTTRVQGSGATTHYVEYRPEFITISCYPLCSWNYDTYRAWCAQNSLPILLQTGVDLLSGKSLISGTAVSNLSAEYQASLMGDTCKGNYNSGNVNFANRKQQFYGGRCHITMDYAMVIDNFFSMYGYAYNKIGVPNTHSRPHWNYVKTAGAKIVGQCPSDDITKICGIYDRGITFWKNPSEVGSYQLDNSPVT